MENQAELEEKTRLINQVLELQHTLEGAENLFSLSLYVSRSLFLSMSHNNSPNLLQWLQSKYLADLFVYFRDLHI